MKNTKLHLWIAINLMVFVLIFIFPSLARLPTFLIVLVSGFLLRDKGETKDEYGKPMSWFGIVIAMSIPALLVISALTGFTAELNSRTTDAHLKIMAIGLGIFFVLIYFVLLFKGGSKSQT